MSDAQSSCSLLLVDDEPSILVALRRTLAKQDYRVLTAESPFEALEILGRESIDVLISDIDMPQMSGVELVAKVRQGYPSVVRILLTGRGTMQSALGAINEGEVYRYLTKPWEAAELVQTIEDARQRALELRRLADAETRTSRRGALLAALTSEHPGIADGLPKDGIYTLDAAAMTELARSLPIPELRTLGDDPPRRANTSSVPATMIRAPRRTAWYWYVLAAALALIIAAAVALKV